MELHDIAHLEGLFADWSRAASAEDRSPAPGGSAERASLTDATETARVRFFAAFEGDAAELIGLAREALRARRAMERAA